MKALSYTWKIIIGIINIAVVFAVFGLASTPFETAILAVLVLIYLSIIGFSSIWGMTTLEVAEATDTELKEIKKLLKKEDADDYTDEYLKELADEKAKAKKYLKVKYYINLGVQFILYIIALGYLISAISS